MCKANESPSCKQKTLRAKIVQANGISSRQESTTIGQTKSIINEAKEPSVIYQWIQNQGIGVSGSGGGGEGILNSYVALLQTSDLLGCDDRKHISALDEMKNRPSVVTVVRKIT